MQIKLEEVIDSVLSADKLGKGATIIGNIQPADDENGKESVVVYANGNANKANHLLIHIIEQIVSQMDPLQKMMFALQLKDHLTGDEDNDNND